MLTKKEVQKLISLSRLHFEESEIDSLSEELNSILKYVEKLNSVDTKGLEPTLQVTGLKNVMREDEVREQLAKPSDLVALAPKQQGGYIEVGRMV